MLATFLVAPVVAVTHDDADALGVAERLLVVPAQAVLVEGRDRRSGRYRILSENLGFLYKCLIFVKYITVKIPDVTTG